MKNTLYKKLKLELETIIFDNKLTSEEFKELYEDSKDEAGMND